jgi:hypothetical protein
MNQPLTDTSVVSQPIQKGGGESPVSFDELESVSNFKQAVKKQEVKEEKEAEESVSKGERKVKKEDKDQPSATGGKRAESKEKKADNDEKAEKAIEQKKLKVKHKDSDLELDLNIELPVKVNGKAESVKLQDALARYSSQKHLDDLYHKIKKEREEFHSQRDGLQSIAKKAKEALSQKDFRSFMEMVAQATGEDATQLYQTTVDNLRSQLEEAARLSPEERAMKALQEENEYYKRKETAAQKEAESRKTFEETSKKVEQVMSQTGMSQADFVKSYDELVELGYKPDAIDADTVGQYYRNYQTIQTIDAKLREVNPDAATEQEIQKIATLAIATKATAEEIALVIDQQYGNQNAKKLAREIDKRQKKATKEMPVRNPMKDPLSWDDLG